MQKRISELDSVRGLAALTVIIGHFQNTYVDVTPTLPKLLSIAFNTPIRLLWSAHEAVILFFMLSGFVLSLPFLNKKKVIYKNFLIKRIFRIYVPYLIAILFAILLKQIFYKGTIEKLGWANGFWSQNIDFGTLLGHFFLLSNFNSNVLNPVIWSLVQEFRISIIFPLLILIVLRFKWIKVVFIGMVFTGVGMIINFLNINHSYGFMTSYGDTIHYSSIFLIGILLAKNKEYIIESFNNLSVLKQSVILIVGLSSYTLAIGVHFLFNLGSLGVYIQDWGIALGAAIFIIVSLSSKKASKFLSLKPVAFLGKISYSLYLYHLPILLAITYSIYGKVSIWIIYVVSFSVTLAISTASWYIVERTSINLGKLITHNKVNSKSNNKSIA